MTDRKCYKCSAPHNRNTDNLRPYGPQGQDVCFKCAMGTPEDEAAARAQMKAAMDRIPGPAILTSNGPKAPGELAGTDAIPLAAVTHAPPVCSNCGLPFDEHADRDGNRHCPNGKTTFDFVFAINPEALDFVRSNLDKSPEELTRMWIDRVVKRDRERAKAKYPPSCRRCNDRGVIETGNNDLPCDCPAGDTALFNTERGTETGAEIKARRR